MFGLITKTASVKNEERLEDNFFAETLEASSPEGGTAALDGISFSCSEEAGAVEKQGQEEDVPVLRDQAETVTSTSPVSNPQPLLYAQALDAIDNLGKREARKVMGGLKLQQKRNGVELSTELMIASIKREFKASPERVIEVINSRLPELLTFCNLSGRAAS